MNLFQLYRLMSPSMPDYEGSKVIELTNIPGRSIRNSKIIKLRVSDMKNILMHFDLIITY